MFTKKSLSLLLILLFVFMISCAPGNTRFDEKPAGFWAGLWHGCISFFTFIISLFNDKVYIYQANNGGNWYNFGFILGLMIFYGGGAKSGHHASRKKCAEKKEWDEIGKKVEAKVKKGIKSWLDDNKKDEWKKIGDKIEKKIKKELRNWAEK